MKKQRWRITFSKTEAMRYTGHLDLILTWERTFRRSGLPLSYSEGYSPRPVINLAAPLPLGYTSRGELGDFWLSEIVTKSDFENSLRKALPPGLDISHCAEISDLHGDKLPNLVLSAAYSIKIADQLTKLSSQISMLLDRQQIIRTRKGKTYDLRPLIIDLSITLPPEPDCTILETTLKLLPGATGRPDELLRELGIKVHKSHICREEIHLKGFGSVQ
jgi:radical SAM-linked protein